jgi:hypothetical protein
MRQLRNLPRLFLRTVIAPHVVLIQRLHSRIHRHHTRTRRIQRDRFDLTAINPGLRKHIAHRRY